MSLPWINDGDLLWDTLILGGEVWPGLPVVDVTVSRSVDLQKKKGDDGANLVDQGYEPAKVKITIRMWLSEQWTELQRLLPTIHPRRKGGIRTPVDIIHPATQLVGVSSIYVSEIGAPVADKGVLTITISAVEWFPEPKKAVSKPKSKSGGDIPSAADVLPPSKDGSVQDNIF